MFRNILMTPWHVLRAYWKTAASLPEEFRGWRQKISLQEPIQFDETRFESTGTSIDPGKLYVVPIAYKLLFFWLTSGGEQAGEDSSEEGQKKGSKQKASKKPDGLKAFFATYKMSEMIGTVWEFRLQDDYNYYTQRWLGFFGAKPRSFHLYQVVGGVKILDIPNALEAADIGLLELKIQLGSDAYMIVHIPVRGEGSYWRDKFNEYHGVTAVAAMIEEAVERSKQLHAAVYEEWRRRRVGM